MKLSKTVKPRLNVPIVKTPSFKLPAWSDYISNTVNFKWSRRQFANWHTFTLSLVFKIVKMFTHFKPWYLHINEKISMLSPERKQKAPGKWYKVIVYKFQILQKPRILKLYKQPFSMNLKITKGYHEHIFNPLTRFKYLKFILLLSFFTSVFIS